jgi:hypothetical protein
VHRSDEDRRLWQYHPSGEARIFDSREQVPTGEGWRDLPFAPGDGGDLDDFARRLDARADRLNAAAEAAESVLKGDHDGGEDRQHEVQSEGGEANGGSGGQDANASEGSQGSGGGKGQDSQSQGMLRRRAKLK